MNDWFTIYLSIVVALDISRALSVQLAKLDNQGNNTWQHSVVICQIITAATEYDNGSHVTTEFQDGSYAIIRFTGNARAWRLQEKGAKNTEWQ